MRQLLLILCSLLIAKTGLVRAAKPDDVCQLMNQHPKWYRATRSTQKKWGIPVPVQLAIIRMESNFKATAKNPKSSAYGFAQAINKTWQSYRHAIGSSSVVRTDFEDATDFIGWYGKQLHDELGISMKNGYALYMAYHEGSGGYRKAVNRKHSMIATLAKRVQLNAQTYRKQLTACSVSPYNDATTSSPLDYQFIAKIAATMLV